MESLTLTNNYLFNQKIDIFDDQKSDTLIVHIHKLGSEILIQINLILSLSSFRISFIFLESEVSSLYNVYNVDIIDILQKQCVKTLNNRLCWVMILMFA